MEIGVGLVLRTCFGCWDCTFFLRLGFSSLLLLLLLFVTVWFGIWKLICSVSKVSLLLFLFSLLRILDKVFFNVRNEILLDYYI